MKKFIVLLLALVTLSHAGGLWVDSYIDVTHDTESWASIGDTYYGCQKIGASFKYGDVFLSHYQYGFYGDNSLMTNFGLGIKRGWEIKKVYIEGFLIGQRDFKAEINSIWAGCYVKADLFSWGKAEES